MKKPFKYNGISFNVAFASKLSEADFVKEFSKGRPAANLDKKQSANFAKFQAPYDLNDEQLRDAYKLIKAHGNDQRSDTESGEVSSGVSGKSVSGANKGADSKL